MNYQPTNPTGRVYQDERGAKWIVELEIGGAVWMRGPHNEIRMANVSVLRALERVA